jgi:hypothetical protein
MHFMQLRAGQCALFALLLHPFIPRQEFFHSNASRRRVMCCVAQEYRISFSPRQKGETT